MIGVTAPAISLFESGKIKPSIDLLRKVSKAFKIDIAKLINDQVEESDTYYSVTEPSEPQSLETRVSTLETEMEAVKEHVANHREAIIQIQMKMLAQISSRAEEMEKLKPSQEPAAKIERGTEMKSKSVKKQNDDLL